MMGLSALIIASNLESNIHDVVLDNNYIVSSILITNLITNFFIPNNVKL